MSVVEVTCYYYSMFILAAYLSRLRRGVEQWVLVRRGHQPARRHQPVFFVFTTMSGTGRSRWCSSSSRCRWSSPIGRSRKRPRRRPVGDRQRRRSLGRPRARPSQPAPPRCDPRRKVRRAPDVPRFVSEPTSPRMRSSRGACGSFSLRSGSGYRVNVDAILLAAFAARGDRMARLAVDLGAGAGAVGLTLLYLGIAGNVDFIERDPFLAALCQKNLAANSFARCGTVHVGDLERALTSIAAQSRCMAPAWWWPIRLTCRMRATPAIDTEGRSGRRQARHGELSPFAARGRRRPGTSGARLLRLPCARSARAHDRSSAASDSSPSAFASCTAARTARPAWCCSSSPSRKPGGLVIEPPFIETDVEGSAAPSSHVSSLLPNALRSRVERRWRRTQSGERVEDELFALGGERAYPH